MLIVKLGLEELRLVEEFLLITNNVGISLIKLEPFIILKIFLNFFRDSELQYSYRIYSYKRVKFKKFLSPKLLKDLVESQKL